MSSIAPVTGPSQSFAPSTVQAAARPAAPAAPQQAPVDRDHDGDSDSGRSVDVRA